MRDYTSIASRVRPQSDRQATMQHVADHLWAALSDQGVSWVGFYTEAPAGGELLLGPRRDKPACSPIGLHGVCGQAHQARGAIVVHDVADLGPNYVACDPRDRSEVVIPLLEPDGACWGVLDLDSFDVGAFNAADVAGLCQVLTAAGFHTPDSDFPSDR